MATKNKGGRPSRITPEILLKLETAFSLGLNDEQACLFADKLPLSTFYAYCKKHPKFQELKEVLKKRPEMNAKTNIAKALENGDVDLSKWYLERKCKDEFSVKQDIGLNGKLSVPVFVGEDEFDSEE